MGQWLEQKIRDSKYNDRYKNSTLIRMPDYLLKRRDGGSQKMIAIWRCRNEKKERDSGGQRKRKDAAYVEWKKDI